MIGFYGVPFIFFMRSYYNINPKTGQDYHLYSRLYPNVIEYLEDNNIENKNVVFVDNINEPQIYFYLSANVKPGDIKERTSVSSFKYNGANYFFEKNPEYDNDYICTGKPI